MNKPKVVIITGPLGSGTSAVAGVVNRLGFPAALWTAPPFAPKWRPEWEDLELLGLLMELAPWGEAPGENERAEFVERFREIVDRRLARLEPPVRNLTGGFPGVAFKSPSLALFMPEILAVVPDAKVIVCIRDPEGLERSFSARHAVLFADNLPAVRATQQLIIDALLGIPDLRVRYERLVADPARTVANIATYLGVNDPPAIAAAAGLIEGG